VYKGVCTPQGTVHAVIGMAGYSLDESWFEQPVWSVKRDGSHYGLTTLHSNSTALHLKYIADDIENPLDEVVIPRKKFY